LTEIDAALSRLDIGSYGSCLACGNPITIERPEILPMASLCIPCQRATETGNR
jgi:RNA polymerase-binding transcription factor DksA